MSAPPAPPSGPLIFAVRAMFRDVGDALAAQLFQGHTAFFDTAQFCLENELVLRTGLDLEAFVEYLLSPNFDTPEFYRTVAVELRAGLDEVNSRLMTIYSLYVYDRYDVHIISLTVHSSIPAL